MTDQAALEARRAELAARREARAAEAEVNAETRALELEVADAEAIDKAETELGVEGKQIAIVRTDLGCVIIKRPTGAAYQRFVDSDLKTKDAEAFVKSCRVHPEQLGFARILSERPGVLSTLADKAVELAGFKRKEVQGKS